MSASYDTTPVYCEEPGRPAIEEPAGADPLATPARGR